MKKTILIGLFSSLLILGGCNFSIEKVDDKQISTENPTNSETNESVNTELENLENDEDKTPEDEGAGKDESMNEKNESAGEESTNSDSNKTDKTSSTEKAEKNSLESNYINYSEANVSASLASENHTVLFFHAPWCPTCKAAEKDFKANLSALAENNINLIKTDFDTSLNLRQKYGIAIQHSFVLLDKDKNAIKKWNGGQTEKLLTMLK